MKSEVDVRHYEDNFFESKYPIVHQGVANIFYQTIELLCTLRVFEEICKIVLSRHCIHGLVNLFQFPINPCVSGWTLNLGECGSLFQFLFPIFLIEIARKDGFAERLSKHFDSWCQRLDGPLIHLCSLEQL